MFFIKENTKTFKNKLLSSVVSLRVALTTSIAFAYDYNVIYAGLTAGIGYLKQMAPF